MLTWSVDALYLSDSHIKSALLALRSPSQLVPAVPHRIELRPTRKETKPFLLLSSIPASLHFYEYLNHNDRLRRRLD